jgi:cytochrome c oxidase accessory protein FixG
MSQDLNPKEEPSSAMRVVEEDLYEIRNKIYPRSVTGVFARWRIALVVLTQLLFYGLPWLNWNDRQAVLFDLIQRKFYIFGLVLWPQDVIYLTLLLILSALALFLFTAIAGRLFCGYACPQTVYTEIFMWIERKVEGDRFARIRLDGEEWPWSLRKIRIKLTKHSLWMLVAVWTGFTFIGYFTSIRTLGHAVAHFSLGPWQLFWLGFYSFATWGNAGFLREQVCKYMCPYARFQSVMVDKDTYLVTYDEKRGDPRGSRGKTVDPKSKGLGDCLDCSICVQVCPTGIDIRDGLQYMCIGCGACVDACNQVMDKMNYKPGLIRYTTERSIKENLQHDTFLQHVLRPRILIYSAIMLVLLVLFVSSLAMRNPLRMDIMRDRGALAREVHGGEIENVYRVQIMNASEHPLELELTATGLTDPKILDSQGNAVEKIMVNPTSNLMLPLKVRVSPEGMHTGTTPIHFEIKGNERDGETLIHRERSEKTTFILPS